jgi:glucokinase-like ROK family protein
VKYIAAADVGGTTIKLGIVSPSGALVESEMVGAAVGDGEKTAGLIASFVGSAKKKYKIDGIGVACAGAIDKAEGIITAADNLRIYNFPIAKALTLATGLPARLENDANCALNAELLFGSAAGMDNVLLVTLGTGIGGAMYLDGKQRTGSRGFGAEFGHMILRAGGLNCSCGLNGCWELYAGASALVRRASVLFPDMRSARQVIERAKSDANVAKVWEEYLEDLALGLQSLMSIFDPEAIIIGGGLSNAGAFLLDGVKRHMAQSEFVKSYYGGVEVKLAECGNNAGMLGAAALFPEVINGGII